MKNFKEIFMKIVFLIAALASIGAVILICVFLFANGIPAIKEIGLFDFLLGDTWRPGNDLYGIWPMIGRAVSTLLPELSSSGYQSAC